MDKDSSKKHEKKSGTKGEKSKNSSHSKSLQNNSIIFFIFLINIIINRISKKRPKSKFFKKNKFSKNNLRLRR